MSEGRSVILVNLADFHQFGDDWRTDHFDGAIYLKEFGIEFIPADELVMRDIVKFDLSLFPKKISERKRECERRPADDRALFNVSYGARE